MLANILPLHTPLTPGVGSKGILFFSEVLLQIKLKGMKHRTPCKQIFCPVKRPQPLDGFKMFKHFFFLKVMLHNKILEKMLKKYASKMFDLMHIFDLLDWVKRSDIEIVQISIF